MVSEPCSIVDGCALMNGTCSDFLASFNFVFPSNEEIKKVVPSNKENTNVDHA